ncbi:hypothetical protein [Saccharothrix syringae]|uniref:hypothetical protein n=1 Tax=Saccharothrix syringae TaxID=103733 RepID=UPI0005277EF1|nr:hypothetical protein [Saccharothrix syringae]
MRAGELPAPVVRGARFTDLDGFAREFSRLLCHYTWWGVDIIRDHGPEGEEPEDGVPWEPL